MSRRAMLLVALLFAAPSLPAATADEDWQALVALDAGPPGRPTTPEEVRGMTLGHLARQERGVRAFLAAHGSDARAFEARLRLSRALQIRADLTADAEPRTEAARILAGLEKSATPAQRPEVDFARIAAFMRTLGKPQPAQRDELLALARRFQREHPGDRRLAALLAQVATLFDMQPKTKLALLEDAERLATDAEVKAGVADDLRRVRLLGREVALSGPTLQGKTADLAAMRGKPVIVIFFAEFSPPSVAALSALKRAVAELPRAGVLGVSLDDDREKCVALLRRLDLAWPAIFDGKGWASPAVRALGINALPTVWLIDGEGRLRSLDALEGTAGQVRQLR